MPELPNEFPDGEIFLPPAPTPSDADEALRPAPSFFQKLKTVHWLVLGGVALVLFSEFWRHNPQLFDPSNDQGLNQFKLFQGALGLVLELIGLGTLVWVVWKLLARVLAPMPYGKIKPEFGLPTTWGHYILLAYGVMFIARLGFILRLILFPPSTTPIEPWDPDPMGFSDRLPTFYYVNQSLVLVVLATGLYRTLMAQERRWSNFGIAYFACAASLVGRRSALFWPRLISYSLRDLPEVFSSWVYILTLLTALWLLLVAIMGDIRARVNLGILHKIGLAAWLVIALPEAFKVVPQVVSMILSIVARTLRQ